MRQPLDATRMNVTARAAEPDLDRLAERLAHRTRETYAIAGFRQAAVLVPLVLAPADAALLLIRRTAHMPSHPGQIAFPGGKMDACDADWAACALREASEELGIDGAAARLLGLLDDVPTPSQFVITPVVAALAREPTLRPNPHEVDAFFYAPLSRLRDPAIYEDCGLRQFEGISYRMHAYRVGEHRIWGATARIVKQVLELLD